MRNQISRLISENSSDVGPKFLCYIPSENSKIYIIDGYLESAELIVKSIPENSLPSNDVLFFPFLSLLINPIEISLKALIEFVEDHQVACKGRCHGFEALPSDTAKAMKEHDIKKLVIIVKKIMDRADKIHRLPDVDDTLNLFEMLFSIGVTSESTRYTKDIKRRTLKLYEKQIYIDPPRLHKEIKKRCFDIISYIEKDQFYLCRVGEYTSKRQREVESSIYFMKKYKSILFIPPERNSKSVSENKFISIKDLIEKPRDQSFKIRRKKLVEELKVLDIECLANIEMGLYFSNPPITVQNFDFFKRQTKKQIIEGIVRRRHLYDRALRGLEIHYQEIKRVRKLKRKK